MAKRVKKAGTTTAKKATPAKKTETKSPKVNNATSKIKDELNKKINDIFTDVKDIKSKEGKDAIKKIEELKVGDAKSTKWIEEQLDKATEENEQLTKELDAKKDEYAKLFDKFNELKAQKPENTGAIESKIRNIFNEMDRNFRGENQQNTKYTDVKIKAMLEKFLQNFEFLRKKK